MKKKKVIRRSSGSKRKIYFGKEAHNAIVAFKEAETKDEKNKIFLDKIHQPFSTLVENLIAVYKFDKNFPDIDRKALKADCLTFLYESIEKFNHEKGARAFSYFNVVAKHWLIIRSKKRDKHIKRSVSIENSSDNLMQSIGLSRIDDKAVEPSHEKKMLEKEARDEIMRLLADIKKKVSIENDVNCINSIIVLFEKIDELELLNKRALFVYLRDLSGLTPRQLSVSMSTIRRHYRDMNKNLKYQIFF